MLQIIDLTKNAEQFFLLLPSDRPVEQDDFVKAGRKLQGPAFISAKQIEKLGVDPYDIMDMLKRAELAVEGLVLGAQGEEDTLSGIIFARNEESLETADVILSEFLTEE